jgi:integrase
LLLFIVFASLLPKTGAIARSGVKDLRFHDTRHTAATRVLRESNLRVVRTLLGHSDGRTTTKYPHDMMDDVLNALEAATPTTEGARAERQGRARHEYAWDFA